eukprot:gene18854-20754_t
MSVHSEAKGSPTSYDFPQYFTNVKLEDTTAMNSLHAQQTIRTSEETEKDCNDNITKEQMTPEPICRQYSVAGHSEYWLLLPASVIVYNRAVSMHYCFCRGKKFTAWELASHLDIAGKAVVGYKIFTDTKRSLKFKNNNPKLCLKGMNDIPGQTNKEEISEFEKCGNIESSSYSTKDLLTKVNMHGYSDVNNSKVSGKNQRYINNNNNNKHHQDLGKKEKSREIVEDSEITEIKFDKAFEQEIKYLFAELDFDLSMCRNRELNSSGEIESLRCEQHAIAEDKVDDKAAQRETRVTVDERYCKYISVLVLVGKKPMDCILKIITQHPKDLTMEEYLQQYPPDYLVDYSKDISVDDYLKQCQEEKQIDTTVEEYLQQYPPDHLVDYSRDISVEDYVKQNQREDEKDTTVEEYLQQYPPDYLVDYSRDISVDDYVKQNQKEYEKDTTVEEYLQQYPSDYLVDYSRDILVEDYIKQNQKEDEKDTTVEEYLQQYPPDYLVDYSRDISVGDYVKQNQKEDEKDTSVEEYLQQYPPDYLVDYSRDISVEDYVKQNQKEDEKDTTVEEYLQQYPPDYLVDYSRDISVEDYIKQNQREDEKDTTVEEYLQQYPPDYLVDYSRDISVEDYVKQNQKEDEKDTTVEEYLQQYPPDYLVDYSRDISVDDYVKRNQKEDEKDTPVEKYLQQYPPDYLVDYSRDISVEDYVKQNQKEDEKDTTVEEYLQQYPPDYLVDYYRDISVEDYVKQNQKEDEKDTSVEEYLQQNQTDNLVEYSDDISSENNLKQNIYASLLLIVPKQRMIQRIAVSVFYQDDDSQGCYIVKAKKLDAMKLEEKESSVKDGFKAFTVLYHDVNQTNIHLVLTEVNNIVEENEQQCMQMPMDQLGMKEDISVTNVEDDNNNTSIVAVQDCTQGNEKPTILDKESSDVIDSRANGHSTNGLLAHILIEEKQFTKPRRKLQSKPMPSGLGLKKGFVYRSKERLHKSHIADNSDQSSLSNIEGVHCKYTKEINIPDSLKRTVASVVHGNELCNDDGSEKSEMENNHNGKMEQLGSFRMSPLNLQFNGKVNTSNV